MWESQRASSRRLRVRARGLEEGVGKNRLGEPITGQTRTISVDEYDAEGGGDEPAGVARHLHIVPLADVVDVHRDAGVRADPVLLHLCVCAEGRKRDVWSSIGHSDHLHEGGEEKRSTPIYIYRVFSSCILA